MKYPTIRIEFGDLVFTGFVCHKYTKGFEALPYDPSRYMYRHRYNEILERRKKKNDLR